MKKFIFFFVAIWFCGQAAAQNRTVTGSVTDNTGLGLPAVTIAIKGTSVGAISDVDGQFTLTVANPSEAILVFSYLGYQTQEILVGDKTQISVTLSEEAVGIDEVVVTALGIKRKEKSLAYATQQIKADELNKVASLNVMNNLAGRSPGVKVNSSAGIGSSTRITIRGSRSIQGSSQPLFVIDGVPVENISPSSSGGAVGNGAGNGGDGMAGLNPDDIESINILKGATAAALYGSKAANGAIMITTKSGKTGKSTVTLSSTYQLERPFIDYEWQETYASKGGEDTWGGPKIKTPRTFHDAIFQNGFSLINSVSLATGNDKAQTYVSYANTTAQGVSLGHELGKHNFNVRAKGKLFEDILSVDGKITVNRLNVLNGSSEGNEQNQIRTVYSFPFDNDAFLYYQIFPEKFNPDRNTNENRWYEGAPIQQGNPFWVLNKNKFEQQTDRYIVKLDLKYDLHRTLNLVTRGSIDKTDYLAENKIPLGGIAINTARNGNYVRSTKNWETLYADALLNYNQSFEAGLTVSGSLGASIEDRRSSLLLIGNNQVGNLSFPNVFSIVNLENGGNLRAQDKTRIQTQSIFGTANFSYKDQLFLDLTARNDWTSTVQDPFFYPSVGLSYILSETLKTLGKLPAALDFLKLRGSWSEVGNGMPFGVRNPQERVSINGTLLPIRSRPFSEMKPETSTSIEFGLDVRLFKKFSLDAAYYQTNTSNQYFSLPAPGGSGPQAFFINAGEVKNQGVELNLSIDVFKTKDFSISSWVNYSTNSNTIVSLPDAIENEFSLGARGYLFTMKEGGNFGDMYSAYFDQNADGELILNGKGEPQLAKDNKGSVLFKKVGTTNPDYNLGFGTEFQYKGISLSFLIDGTFGGNVISATEAELHKLGLTPRTATDRDNGGVPIPGIHGSDSPTPGKRVERVDAELYYRSAPFAETGIYEATNIRLRELSLGYSVPAEWLKPIKMTSLRLSAIGRNLLFFYKDAPFDPERFADTSSLSGGSSDYFSLPASRFYGLSLNMKF